MNWDQCSERMPGNILQQREACPKEFKAQEWNTQRLRLKTDLWNKKFDVKMATAQSHGNQISMENWSSPFWSPSLLGISMWFSSFCSFFPKSDVTPETEQRYSLIWLYFSCFGIQWSCEFNLCIWEKSEVVDSEVILNTSKTHQSCIFTSASTGYISTAITLLHYIPGKSLQRLSSILSSLLRHLEPYISVMRPKMFPNSMLKPGMLGRFVGGVLDNGEFLIFTWNWKEILEPVALSCQVF